MAGRSSWLEKLAEPGAMARYIGWLEYSVTRVARRRAVKQFAAYRWNGSALAQDKVRDISASGVYLFTKDRWRPGTIVWLTLQQEGPVEVDPMRRITTRARVVRCEADGVALTFPSIKEADLTSLSWERLLETVIATTQPVEMLVLVRMVEALAFLSQICPDGIDEIGEWVCARAGSHKLANALNIVLKAERLFDLEHVAADKVRVNPQVAVRILECGSCTDEDWVHNSWAGLLLASCSADGRDQSNLEFVELFSQLTAMPLRIFTVVCTIARKVISESGVSARTLACNMSEVASTVGSRKNQMERDLESLAELGLIEKTIPKAATLLTSDEAFITPTSLGLRLFALCNGHRGSLRDFYAEYSSPTQAHERA
jgi:hypothetical protein